MSTRIAVDLAHGYTLADVHDLARFSVHVAGPMAGNWQDRYDLAYSAIVLHLYTVDSWPQRYDLVRAGRLGIYATVEDERRHYGYYRAHTDGGLHGRASSPAFQKFWWELTAASNFETRIIERIGLAHVWAALSHTDRRVLGVLAAHDCDYQAAAAAIGVSVNALSSSIKRARGRALSLFYGDETPHRSGHYISHRHHNRTRPPCGTLSGAWAHRRRKEPLCHLCAPADHAYNTTRPRAR